MDPDPRDQLHCMYIYICTVYTVYNNADLYKKKNVEIII